LTILPTHRVVSNLPGFSLEKFRAALGNAFDWHSNPFSGAADKARAFEKFRRDLADRGQRSRAIGMFAGGGAFHLLQLRQGAKLEALLPHVSPRQRQLDVVLLHGLLLERGLGITSDAVRAETNISYEREIGHAIASVEKGRAQLCFLLNPVSVETVAEMAMAGEVLPQKSTDFYPKLMSGISMYRLEE